MGGLLWFIGESGDENIKSIAIVESLGSETRPIFEEMRKTLSPLDTWEMKNTCAGPSEVMIAVPALASGRVLLGDLH